MRFWRIVPVSIVLGCVFEVASPWTLADEREVFQYGSGSQTGALIHDTGSRWVEIVGTQERFTFDEVGRTDDTIELLDRNRDVGLKVHGDHGQLRLRNSKAWRPWQRGKWIGRADLPANVKFVPSDDKIRLVYFVASDREPIVDYERRIRVVMAIVDDLYRSALRDQGYPFEGLNLERNEEGEPIVHLVRADQTAIDQRVGRRQLMAHLSRDEWKTWEGGLMLDDRTCSYPFGFQSSDGTIYVSYERQRWLQPEILLARFSEEDVAAGKLVSERPALRLLVNKAGGISEESYHRFKPY